MQAGSSRAGSTCLRSHDTEAEPFRTDDADVDDWRQHLANVADAAPGPNDGITNAYSGSGDAQVQLKVPDDRADKVALMAISYSIDDYPSVCAVEGPVFATGDIAQLSVQQAGGCDTMSVLMVHVDPDSTYPPGVDSVVVTATFVPERHLTPTVPRRSALSLSHIVAIGLAATILGSASCEGCFSSPHNSDPVGVINETDQVVVVEDLAGRVTSEVLRLDPGQRGSFRPVSATDDDRLTDPIVVRTVPDGRIVGEAPAGTPIEGLEIVAR